MNQQVGNQGYQPQHQRQISSGAPYVPSQQMSAAEYQQQQQQFHLLPPMNHPPPPLQHHHEHAHAHQQPMQQAHLHLLQSFWMSQMHDVENVPQDFKLHHLPLARIKKVMKTDEDVKMISAEAPMLFDRGCEIFITELTLRAWIHAEENKRRTLQRSDIAAAIVKTDMFDFLIDIVPREEYKMSVTKEPKASNYHHPTVEQRRSQDLFMPPPTSAQPNLAGALEGYGYPYILENEAFSMGMDPNQQQQQQQQQQHQQQQLQMQYMGVNPQQAI
ncbi:hypothetical protein BG006_009503 [Podila minutissima]|uniref:Core Histone H2A/H2B/H3 domain-containing protein n=1 Tax=Podila minutissima TaxID=64525 RepID=A0A9P5SI66_9FUNG|nr:hypothetical protein BG006_009503 [Podila minutissima]